MLMTYHYYSNPCSASDWSGLKGNEKHYPNLCDDTSSVWNFCSRHFAGKPVRRRREMSIVFSGYPSGEVFLTDYQLHYFFSYFIRYNAGNKFLHSHKGRLVCDWLSQPIIILIDLEVPPALLGTSGRLGEQERSH